MCKKLAALPPCFTVLSLRLVCKLLIGCIYLPGKAGWTDIQLPNAKSEFLQPFCIVEKAKRTSTAVVGGKNISFSRDE